MINRVIKKIAIFLVILTISTGIATLSSAVSNENKVPVCIRIVWHSKSVPYAAADVILTQYIDSECTIETGSNYAVTVKKSKLWQTTVNLSSGYWKITSISPVNVWQEVIYGSSDMFEVKDHLITVYAGVAPSGESYELPDPWCVDGEDTRSFWIWENEEESEESSNNDTEYEETVDKIFVDDRESSENKGMVPEETIASESSQKAPDSTKEEYTEVDKDNKETQSKSAVIGSWAIMIVLGAVIIGGVIYLVIKKRKR